MKFLAFFALAFFNICLSQNIEDSEIKCNYLTKFLVDTTDAYSKKEEMTGLWIGRNTSLFKSDQKAKYDSLSLDATKKSFEKPQNGKVILDFSKLPKAYFIPEVYKKGGTVNIFDKVLGTTFEYESDQKIKWTLLDETRTISTYRCRKAVGKYRNKNMTAWYTEEIPISEGPYNFKGLPGLVIEAYDDKDFFHFTLIKLKNIKEPIVPIRNVVKTEYAKFAKKRSDFKNDPAGAYFTVTGKVTPKDQIERIFKLHRSKNNYLD